MIRTRRVRRQTALGLLGLAAIAGSLPCFGGENSCPDMSSHERVLQEGQKMMRGGSMGFDERADAAGLVRGRDFGYPETGPFRHSSQTASDQSETSLWSIAPTSAEVLSLGTLEEISIASTCAEHLLERNEFRSAHKLYSRLLSECPRVQKAANIETTAKAGIEISQILAAQQSSSDSNTQSISQKNAFTAATVIRALRFIDRNYVLGINDSLMPYLISTIRKSPDPRWTFDKVLTDVDEAKDLGLKTRSEFVQFATNDRLLLKALKEEQHRSFHESVAQNTDVVLRAHTLDHNYKMALECLHMADELDRTAFDLETEQTYEMAMRLYKESLEIKTKNLGTINTDTIQQYGDIARVYASEHKYKQAEETYEQALALFRKLRGPREGYVTMLENYGDMLNQTNQKQKATEILNEANRYSQNATKK